MNEYIALLTGIQRVAELRNRHFTIPVLADVNAEAYMCHYQINEHRRAHTP